MIKELNTTILIIEYCIAWIFDTKYIMRLHLINECTGWD